MNTSSRLMSLERIYDKARMDCSKDQMVSLGKDYATIMQAIVSLEKFETESLPKKAVLLGGKG